MLVEKAQQSWLDVVLESNIHLRGCVDVGREWWLDLNRKSRMLDEIIKLSASAFRSVRIRKKTDEHAHIWLSIVWKLASATRVFRNIFSCVKA